jgi:hypothetical protein
MTMKKIEEKVDRFLNSLLGKVKLEKVDLLHRYLLQHPDILPIISKAIELSKAKFPEAQLILDLWDWDGEDDFHPVLYVRLKDYPPSFHEELVEIQRNYLSLLSHSTGWFLLTTDFKTADS